MTRIAPDARYDTVRSDPSRDRVAAASWLDFFVEHTVEHPAARCPVHRLYESWEHWAARFERRIVTLGIVVIWMREAGYRLAGRCGPANEPEPHAAWLGLIGREYDPKGWPSTWNWPPTSDPSPPGWWTARSRMWPHLKSPRPGHV